MKEHYINGEWLSSDASTPNRNPSDLSDTIGRYAKADRAQARLAILAAAHAAKGWRHGSLQERANGLDQVAGELRARAEELGDLLAREQGKTLREAIAEVIRASDIFRYFAGEVMRLQGERLPSMRAGIDVEIAREPLGVVGLIAPWNFPIAIPAWKIAPALAYGNTVVFKPADLVPGSAWALAEIISRAGFPDGVFNLVMGAGSEVGQELLENELVTGVSFTGSSTIGRRVVGAMAARLAKVQAEMGGKNPLIVLNDADVETAVHCAVQGAFYSTGQRCTASSRFIVEKGIYLEFTAKLRAAMEALTVGDARAAGTDIGPVASEAQLATNLSYVDIGKHEGASLAHGGVRLSRDKDGYYFSPTLFVDASNEMRIAREEIFGPIACTIPADDYEHALSLANDSAFGLSAGICTSSLKFATHFKRHAEAGMVMVNTPTAGVDYHVPFGGTKSSSIGAREQGSYAAEFYTTVKTSYIAA